MIRKNKIYLTEEIDILVSSVAGVITVPQEILIWYLQFNPKGIIPL